MRYLFTLIFFACLCTLFPQDFIQIGQDIDEIMNIPGSLSLSSNGKTVAIGSGSYSNRNVRIYQNNRESWSQIGQEIKHSSVSEIDYTHYNVSLSANGNIVAIGDYGSPGGLYLDYYPHVRIYQNIGGSWQQIGDDIDGEPVRSYFGCSISLSSDGKTVAIGVRITGKEVPNHVRIYKLISGNKWHQIGQDIYGENVSLSSDGHRFAIVSENQERNSKSVNVYEFIGSKWSKIGDDIDGSVTSLSINSDGTIVAVGDQWKRSSGYAAGQVRVYKLNGSSWHQLGQDINGKPFERFGVIVSCSEDGRTIAINTTSTPIISVVGVNDHLSLPKFAIAKSRIYNFNGSNWVKMGGDIEGGKVERGYYDFSSRVRSLLSLSSDGKTVATSIHTITSGGASSSVRIYSILNLKEKIKLFVEEKINIWQQKGEYEKTVAYQNRVNETTRNLMIKKYQKEAFEIEKKTYSESIDFNSIKIKDYDADNETFLLSSTDLGEIIISVPIDKAKNFKDNFNSVKYQNKNFDFSNNGFVLTKVDIVDNIGNVFSYTNKNQSTYAQTKIDYNFSAIEVNIPNQAVNQNNIVKQTNTISVGKSDVDVNVPENATKNSNRYALVIGNEDYSSKQSNLSKEQDVEFARNDASSFKKYLVSTLGFEEDHVTLLTDATGGIINRETAKLVQLAKLDPKSEIVFYYAGHGLPDDDKNPYLLPVDVSTINLEEDGLPLKELYTKLASSNAAKITVFLDACFSGGGRDQGLLAARGVKIKPKEEAFTGNMVVFASSSGEERSLPYEEKEHGFFTYFLLKKLQETKGNTSYGELSAYIKKEVARNSLLKKSLQQTPHTNISPRVQEKWKTWSFR